MSGARTPGPTSGPTPGRDALPPDLTRLGHLLGPHGVRGGVKLYLLGDPAQVRALRRVYVEGRGWLALRRTEALAPGLALHLAGVEARDAAEALRGLHVYAADAELPAPEDGVYYYHELRGLMLRAADGSPLGTVSDVLDGGHQDLLVVAHAAGEALLPLQAPYVEVVRGETGRPAALLLSADAPGGLLDVEALDTDDDPAPDRAEPR